MSNFLETSAWNYLSAAIGFLAHLYVPNPLRKFIYGTYVNYFQVDLSEVSEELESYSNFSQFFLRELKPGSRKVNGDLSSPIDGVARNIARIEDGTLDQIKGKKYSLADLLGPAITAKVFAEGVYLNLYLSPTDYHRVHAPCDMELLAVHCLGSAHFPVNDWACWRVDQLFIKNTRVVFECQHSTIGYFVMIMVGAANVGSIVGYFPGSPKNLNAKNQADLKNLLPLKIKQGDQLAGFDLGSTVVMIFPNSQFAEKLVKDGGNCPRKIKVGERLG